MKTTHFLIFLMAAAFCLMFCSCEVEKSDPVDQVRSLPVYKLGPPSLPEDQLLKFAADKLGLKGQFERKEEKFTLRKGPRMLEVYKESGAVWLADYSQMWNASLRPSLSDTNAVLKLADAFKQENSFLFPKTENQPFEIVFSGLGGTFASFFDANKQKREDVRLDIQAKYAVNMRIAGKSGEVQTLPVIGGGGDFTITYGEQGKLIGFSGGWRPIEKLETESAIISSEVADAQFKEMMKSEKLISFSSKLAYYAAPASGKQAYLYPVYAYSGIIEKDSQTIPLRIVLLPATEWGKKMEEGIQREGIQPRDPKSFPQRRSTMPDEQLEMPDMQNVYTLDTAYKSRQVAPASKPWAEAATSWIGVSGGLGGSQNNAKGFVDVLASDGWSINFNWGDANAWESDWRRNNNSWVDAADFVFYTGHANMNGWDVRNPDDGFVDFSEVGSTPGSSRDIWGQLDLEWLIVAACGPLQDEVISPGGGDVFDRWDGAFDGLHQLLGYGAVTFDNEDEGKTMARYAIEGETVINAWFRTAREIQPATNGYSPPNGNTIWVGVMYVVKPGADPSGDHIHTHGSISSDPNSPTVYVAMWTTT